MRHTAGLRRNNQLQDSTRIRKISEDDLTLVHKLIERCLVEYMNEEEAASELLNQAGIHPDFTRLVWKKLEEENAEFFEQYRARLILKRNIKEFNVFLRRYFEIMQPQHNHMRFMSGQHSQQMGLMNTHHNQQIGNRHAWHARVNEYQQSSLFDSTAYPRPDSASFQPFIQYQYPVDFSTPPGMRPLNDVFSNYGHSNTFANMPAARHPQGCMINRQRSAGMPVSYDGSISGVHSLNPASVKSGRNAAFNHSAGSFHSTNDQNQNLGYPASFYSMHHGGHPNLSSPRPNAFQNIEVGNINSQHPNDEDMEYSGEDNRVPDQMSEAGEDDRPSC